MEKNKFITLDYFVFQFISIYVYVWGTHGVMVIILGSRLSYQSSNPECSYLHFTNNTGKGMNPAILHPTMGK